jgi:hypothetical protein
MAMGPVFLASMFQMPIVPVGIGYCRPWRLATWDRFAIGRPGSRARIVTGPKIYLPARMSRDEMEANRIRIESMINELTGFAEQWSAQGFHVPAGERPPKARRRAVRSDANPRPHPEPGKRRAACEGRDAPRRDPPQAQLPHPPGLFLHDRDRNTPAIR